MTERIDSLIIKLLQNNLSDKEQIELDQWRNSSEKNETYFNNTVEAYAKSDWDDAIEIPEMSFDFSEIEEKAKSFLYLKYVAMLILALSFSYFYFFQNENVEIENILASRTVHLPDGSIVILNKDSKLIYNEDFNSTKRQVTLIGQAFFDVKKSDKPFIIHAIDSKIEVLGTSFDVRTNLAETEVQVSTGKVRFSNGKGRGEILLTKNMSARLKDGVLHKNPFKLESYEIASWRSERWKLRENSLVDFLSFLGKEYNTKISYDEGKLRNHMVSGSFKKNSLKSILEQISELYELDLQYRNDVYILKGKHEKL